MPHEADAERRFYALLRAVMWLLQREGRTTYRELNHVFGLNETVLEEVRKELVFRQVARDEQGVGLVWTAAPPPVDPPVVATPSPLAIPETPSVPSSAIPASPPLVPPPAPPHNGPPEGPVAPSTELEPDDISAGSESVRNSPEAERRHLTVMFCDLADSTQLSQQLDPEDLRDVVRAYQATAAEVIQQYEGHMAQYLGDGLLIYFGWPLAHEDDAQRAAYAGLGIVEAITTSLNPRLEHEKGVQLTVRLGIHTGPVVVGEMGGGGRHENLATGETVNIASRLEGVAAPNTVMISQVTARLVRDAFVLEALGPHDLKGVAEPMPVFRVLGPMERHEDETVVAGIPFLVGRDEEMGLLARRWEQSKAGLGQVVLISGTAGIGKSSLVEVLRARVRDEGLPRIAFRCSSYHTNSALYPVITHVERLLDFQREDASATKLDKLEQGLRPYSQPLEEVVPLLASVLSVPLGDRYPALTMSPQQQKQQTLDVLVAWMLEEGERQPVLVAWEDLQWADPSTLEMLGLILEQTPMVPMLHVLTYRSEFELPWPTRSHMTPITLNRLERPQVEALIMHLARGKALPAEVVEHLVTKTDGVPLYVEELTKMLLESDVLRAETDQYVLTGPLLSLAIPDTLQDSLMARLDQMNTAKEVAQLGAVLGREFAYGLIEAISSQDEESLQAGLAQLVEAELLYQRGRPPRARYIFKHAMIQDAAYASLLRSSRQQIHQRIAQQLEQRFPEVVETQPELVAHHYTEASCPEQAIGYWQQAGQYAARRSANQEAIQHLTKGLEPLSALPETPARIQQELDLQMALGLALMALKGFGHPEVEQAYARARALCQQVGDTPKLFPVMWGLWRYANSGGAGSNALELAEQLLAIAERAGEAVLLLVARQVVGSTLYFRGEFTSALPHLEHGKTFDDHEQHRTLAIRYGTAPGVQCLAYGAQTLWFMGYPEQARHWIHEAITLAQTLDHAHSAAMALYYAARLELLCRNAAAASAQAEASRALSTERGFALWGAMSLFVQGWARFEQGEEHNGLEQMHEGMRATAATGNEVARSIFSGVYARVYSQAGRVDESWSAVQEALDAVEASGRRDYEAELYRLKGELFWRQAEPEMSEGEACFQQALVIARRQEAKSWELRAAISLARLWQSQGKRQEAYDLLTPVYEWFTEGFDTADLMDAKQLLGELSEEPGAAWQK